MSYELRVSEQAIDVLESLEQPTKQRIKDKIDEIEKRLEEFDIDPDKAVEKRLKSPYNRFLQQRVGDYRIWLEDIKEDKVLLVSFIGHKEEVKDRLN